MHFLPDMPREKKNDYFETHDDFEDLKGPPI